MSRAHTIFTTSSSVTFKEEILDWKQNSRGLGKEPSFLIDVYIEAKYLLKCISFNLESLFNF